MKIYARGENNILEWEVEVQGNKYRTITGGQGAKKVTSDWTVCESKSTGRSNETSADEQAQKEAEALYKKKLKTGYFKNVTDIDNSTYIEPMLANKFEDHKHKIEYPVMVDRKYNGMRQVTSHNGAFTRKGEAIITAPHIVKILESLFKKYPDLVLDGELYNHEYRFKLNELIKLVRKTKHFTPEDLIQSEKIVKYYVYDGYGFDAISEDTKCSDRREGLKKLLNGIKYIEVVEYEWAKNEEGVYKVYEEYVQDGYEGAIVRATVGYQHKRTNALLKVKPIDDDEAEILALLEGNGNWAGAAKIVTLKWKDKIFNGSVKGCYENCAKMLKEKSKWIGKTVTFTYNGFTGKGTPNFAQLNPENCFKGDR